MGAPFFSAAGRGEREGLGVSVGLGTGLSSGVAVGVGDALLRFDFVFDVGLGVGVGEIFFRFGVAVGDGVGVAFLAERLLCLCVGAGVGVGSKIFLILGPNDSSDGLAVSSAPNNIATIRNHFMGMLVFKQAGTRCEIQNSNCVAVLGGDADGTASPQRGDYNKAPCFESRWLTAPLSELAPEELLC